MMKMLSVHARELLEMPEDWEVYAFEMIRKGDKVETIKLTGAVAPLKTKGVCLGKRNWRKLDKTTRRTAYITPEKHSAWLKLWEQKNNKCSDCMGTGEVFASWNVNEGTKHKICPACNGTGFPKTEVLKK